MSNPERGGAPEQGMREQKLERAQEVPEVVVAPERSLQLLSILLRGYDRTWGEPQSKLAVAVDEHFAQHPLAASTRAALDRIKVLDDDGVDEETLSHLAASLAMPSRTTRALEFVEQNKSLPVLPRDVRDELAQHLEELQDQLPARLLDRIRTHEQAQRERYERVLPEVRRHVEAALVYFHPSPSLLRTSEVHVVPWDGLFPQRSGSSIDVGDALLLRAAPEPGALTHEFLHQFINPIAKNTIAGLDAKSRASISQSASLRLTQDEQYGGDPEVLLAEELIRTYTDVIARGQQPETESAFTDKLRRLSDAEFATLSQQEPLRSRLRALDVTSRADLVGAAPELWRRFERNELRVRLFSLYEDYTAAAAKDPQLRFEDFAPSVIRDRVRA